VAGFVTTNVARAIVDLNRPPDDFGPDGMIKTHTCRGLPIYKKALLKEQTEILLDRYYWPYHKKITELSKNLLFGLDCHTMLAIGPPVSPDPGQKRPEVCLSNANSTCPQSWLEMFAGYLAEQLGTKVSKNQPFKGGHIIRYHSKTIHWMQLELSRDTFLSLDAQRSGVLRALRHFCKALRD
jgi:formiminoglutamase